MNRKSSYARAREAGYVYVLHFGEKLGDHAVHYIGCTSDPAGRLAAHAAGCSSSIMRVAGTEGIGFKLGALGQTHRRGMRRIEKQAKAWKNAKAFCEICCPGSARAIPGTQPQPLEMLPFATSSEECTKKPKPITVSVSGPRTPIMYINQMRELSETEKDALGFIPMGGLRGVNDYFEAGHVILARQGSRLVGYCLFSKLHQDELRIQQTITEDACRGNGIGRQMVEKVRALYPKARITARVRDDLDANGFWQAIGFTHVRTDTHETSGAALNVWVSEPESPQLKLFTPAA